jgi:hypothetical protein
VLIEVHRREVHSDLPAVALVVETVHLDVIAMDLLLLEAVAIVTVRRVSVAMVAVISEAAMRLLVTAVTVTDLQVTAGIAMVLQITDATATDLQVTVVAEIEMVCRVTVAIGPLVTDLLTVVIGSSVHQLKEVTIFF